MYYFIKTLRKSKIGLGISILNILFGGFVGSIAALTGASHWALWLIIILAVLRGISQLTKNAVAFNISWTKPKNITNITKIIEPTYWLLQLVAGATLIMKVIESEKWIAILHQKELLPNVSPELFMVIAIIIITLLNLNSLVKMVSGVRKAINSFTTPDQKVININADPQIKEDFLNIKEDFLNEVKGKASKCKELRLHPGHEEDQAIKIKAFISADIAGRKNIAATDKQSQNLKSGAHLALPYYTPRPQAKKGNPSKAKSIAKTISIILLTASTVGIFASVAYNYHLEIYLPLAISGIIIGLIFAGISQYYPNTTKKPVEDTEKEESKKIYEYLEKMAQESLNETKKLTAKRNKLETLEKPIIILSLSPVIILSLPFILIYEMILAWKKYWRTYLIHIALITALISWNLAIAPALNITPLANDIIFYCILASLLYCLLSSITVHAIRNQNYNLKNIWTAYLIQAGGILITLGITSISIILAQTSIISLAKPLTLTPELTTLLSLILTILAIGAAYYLYLNINGIKNSTVKKYAHSILGLQRKGGKDRKKEGKTETKSAKSDWEQLKARFGDTFQEISKNCYVIVGTFINAALTIVLVPSMTGNLIFNYTFTVCSIIVDLFLGYYLINEFKNPKQWKSKTARIATISLMILIIAGNEIGRWIYFFLYSNSIFANQSALNMSPQTTMLISLLFTAIAVLASIVTITNYASKFAEGIGLVTTATQQPITKDDISIFQNFLAEKAAVNIQRLIRGRKARRKGNATKEEAASHNNSNAKTPGNP